MKCSHCCGIGTIEGRYIPRDHSNRAFVWDYAHDGYQLADTKCDHCNGTGHDDVRKFTENLAPELVDHCVKLIINHKN